MLQLWHIFLSDSLHNLNSICWCKTDDVLDEAEKALAQEYDGQVEEFYDDVRERFCAVCVASACNLDPQPPDHR